MRPRRNIKVTNEGRTIQPAKVQSPQTTTAKPVVVPQVPAELPPLAGVKPVETSELVKKVQDAWKKHEKEIGESSGKSVKRSAGAIGPEEYMEWVNKHNVLKEVPLQYGPQEIKPWPPVLVNIDAIGTQGLTLSPAPGLNLTFNLTSSGRILVSSPQSDSAFPAQILLEPCEHFAFDYLNRPIVISFAHLDSSNEPKPELDIG